MVWLGIVVRGGRGVVGVIGVGGFGFCHILYDEHSRITLNLLGNLSVCVDETGCIYRNLGHHITGVMWGGNQRLAEWENGGFVLLMSRVRI